MLALGGVAYHDSVAHRVGMFRTSQILCLVVLDDALELALLDIVPVRFERDIEQGIAPKYQLRWRCLRGGELDLYRGLRQR